MWIECPACGHGEFLMRCLSGGEPEVNAGPEFELQERCGCDCILSPAQDDELHAEAARRYPDWLESEMGA